MLLSQRLGSTRGYGRANSRFSRLVLPIQGSARTAENQKDFQAYRQQMQNRLEAM